MVTRLGPKVHSIAFAAALSMSHLLCVGQSLHVSLFPPHEGMSPIHARHVCSQPVWGKLPDLQEAVSRHGSDPRYLRRSCPCLFRCICDETFAVHFFFSIPCCLEDVIVRAPKSGRACWHLWVLVKMVAT